MGRKKKALQRYKRLGNLGKYAEKFSALVKTTSDLIEKKVEKVIEKMDQTLHNTPEAVKTTAEEKTPDKNDEVKIEKTKTTRKRKSRSTPTTRKSRSPKTKTKT